MEEIWAKVPDYELIYEVSNLGRIKRLRYLRKNLLTGTMSVFEERILKPFSLKNGYLLVDLCKNNTKKKYLLHRIVAMSFIPNNENKDQVNHINGIKTDNRAINLEWNTRSENQKHAIRIGLRHARGENNSQRKLNDNMVMSILNDKRPYKIISNEYNVSIPTISDIKRGYSWTHITKLPNKKNIICTNLKMTCSSLEAGKCKMTKAKCVFQLQLV